MQIRAQFVQVSKHASEKAIKFNNLLILNPQMISRPRGGSHDWVQQTPRSFEITVLDIIFLKWSLNCTEGRTAGYGKHPRALISSYWNFSLSTRYKLNFRSLSIKQHERALLAQETHTSLKSHHELNIWQMISLLKVRLLTNRIIQQVSKEIKGFMQVVSKIYDEVVNFFNKLLNIAIMISYPARSTIKEFHISSLLTLA
jgi:hypothetical protein